MSLNTSTPLTETSAPGSPPSPAPSAAESLILVVDDREDNRQAYTEAFQRQGYAVLVASGGRQALEKIAAHSPDVVVCDLKMPDLDGLEVLRTARNAPTPPEFILITAFGTVETAVDALKEGAFNYLTKPVNLKDLRAQVEKALEHRAMRRDIGRLRRQVEVASAPGAPAAPAARGAAPGAPATGGFIFQSTAMRNLMAMVERLGLSQSSVLIEGESGVGKEVVAQALHRASARGTDNRPFIAVHCAALPETLLESELFGYERGAFTGAEKQMIGRLELADGGTLFLDEIGEIPLSMQVKLLRVLEQRELTRVGGRATIKVNFRLVAATNRNLDAEVAAGRFREDLFYRINVVRLTVPSLRERRDDILPLFRSFLGRFAAEQGQPAPRLTSSIEPLLLNYAWPGNVRELRNLAERLSIFSSGRDLLLDDLPANIQQPGSIGISPRGAAAPGALPPGLLDLEQLEKLTIQKALAQFNGNRSTAAEALGISRRTLQRKLKEYKMAEAEDDRDEPADATPD